MRRSGIYIVVITILTTSLLFAQKGKSLESITYFPRQTYHNLDKLDSMGFIEKSVWLLNFREQKLFNTKDNSTIFRFTWFRSFDYPMVLLLTNVNDQTVLQVKTGNKIGFLDQSEFHYEKLKNKEVERFRKYANGELDSSSVADIFQRKGFYVKDTVKFKYSIDKKEISESEFKIFRSLITNEGFWTRPASLGSSARHDGTDWLIEGYTKENGYHVVDRHSPDVNDRQLREIGERLIKLYGKIGEKEIR
jgi:hypothetical protein